MGAQQGPPCNWTGGTRLAVASDRKAGFGDPALQFQTSGPGVLRPEGQPAGFFWRR
jgi:hypothetical protein